MLRILMKMEYILYTFIGKADLSKVEVVPVNFYVDDEDDYEDVEDDSEDDFEEDFDEKAAFPESDDVEIKVSISQRKAKKVKRLL